MIGIYIIKNTINDKVYIGQSVNIEERWRAHRYKGKEGVKITAPEANSPLHVDMRKYGCDNYYYEVLEQCSEEELDTKERYWIEKYNSFYNGYNRTKGGSIMEGKSSRGEENGKAKLTEKDVYQIREYYNDHVPFREVYELYKERISKKGLQNIWHFQTWAYIHPEYHNEENKYWHSHNAKANSSEVASDNKRCFSKEEIIEMRKRYKDGETVREIWRSTCPNKAESTVRNAILKVTYKDID